jgi:hypothetical protein
MYERRKEDRRAPALTAHYGEAMKLIAETKYTGWYMVHCHEGVPQRIELPNPVGIQMTR